MQTQPVQPIQPVQPVQPVQPIQCSHRTCAEIRKKNASHSAAVLLTLRYQNQTMGFTSYSVGLVRETGGMYRDTYNLIAGKGTKEDFIGDNFCWIRCAIRELYEEAALFIDSDEKFDKLFRKEDKQVRYIIHKDTPIFIARLPHGTSRSEFKKPIKERLQNQNLPYCYRETSDYELFNIFDGFQIEGKENYQISKFAEEVLQLIDSKLLTDLYYDGKLL